MQTGLIGSGYHNLTRHFQCELVNEQKMAFLGCFVRSDIIICNNWNSHENKMLKHQHKHNEMHAMKRASILWSTSIKLELLTFFVCFRFRFRFGSFWHFDKGMLVNWKNRIIWWSRLKWNILFSSSLRNPANCTATKMRFDFVVIQYGRNFKWM